MKREWDVFHERIQCKCVNLIEWIWILVILTVWNTRYKNCGISEAVVVICAVQISIKAIGLALSFKMNLIWWFLFSTKTIRIHKVTIKKTSKKDLILCSNLTEWDYRRSVAHEANTHFIFHTNDESTMIAILLVQFE